MSPLWALLGASALAAAGGRLVEGNPSSSVRVIIFEDLQCSDCAALRRMLDDRLLPCFKAKVAFEHRDFPLAKHLWARQAAIASRYFQELNPDLAVEFRRRTMAEMSAITPGNLKDRISAFAASKGIDAAKAVAALDDSRLAGLVEQDYQDGIARGVSRTPTAFVNGQPFIETFTFEEIAAGVDAALAEAAR